jgi:hypothetical protein
VIDGLEGEVLVADSKLHAEWREMR